MAGTLQRAVTNTNEKKERESLGYVKWWWWCHNILPCIQSFCSK